MAVLPDDVCGFGALLESEWLAQEGHVLGCVGVLSDKVSKALRVVAFESDEGGCGNSKSIKLLEQIVNLGLALAHLVEVLSRDAGTALTEGLDQLRVVEGEHDISDFSAWVLEGLSFLFSIEFLSSPFVVLNPFSKFAFNLLGEGLLESLGGSDTLFSGATWCLIDSSLPLFISFFLDREFAGEVASGDSGAVPFDLLDSAALVHVPDRDGEEEGDDAG